VATGAVELNGQALGAGDSAAIEEEGDLSIVGSEAAELVLFDLA
jgi:quercetin 2,3-dioxygenase